MALDGYGVIESGGDAFTCECIFYPPRSDHPSVGEEKCVCGGLGYFFEVVSDKHGGPLGVGAGENFDRVEQLFPSSDIKSCGRLVEEHQ